MRAGRLIVALDPEPGDSLDYWLDIVSKLCDLVVGFKVGLPFTLMYGVNSLKTLKSLCGNFIIVDFKLADIGYVMRSIVSQVSDHVDGVIAHSFIGTKGALDELKEYLDRLGVKLILVTSMSHDGSLDVIDVNIDRLLWVAERVKPWGLVAPATRPAIITYIRRRAPWARILAPGIGPQGARPGEALKAGADYEIIGRLITRAPNPVELVEEIIVKHSQILTSGSGGDTSV